MCAFLTGESCKVGRFKERRKSSSINKLERFSVRQLNLTGWIPGFSMEIEKSFFLKSSEVYNFCAVLCADSEYRIYISIGLNLVSEKQFLLLNRL